MAFSIPTMIAESDMHATLPLQCMTVGICSSPITAPAPAPAPVLLPAVISTCSMFVTSIHIMQYLLL
eukprot:8867093-Ditylum_brightwellii.AAC.1